MQQLVSLWSNLGPRKQISAAVAILAVLGTVLVLGRIAAAPSFGLLYAGLDPSASGEVIRSLDQRGARFEVRGDSIWVESRSRDQLRMALAADGLPANGAAGYELLDGLSGFGTTSQMFDAAYSRAKEGELARTLAAASHIRSARVHIAQAQGQPFRRQQVVTASVTVTTTSGGLNAAQARAIRHLVAASVAGLLPENVAVIDAEGGLVPVQEQGILGGGDDRAHEMRANLERLLEARVGPGRALVEVNIEVMTEQELIRERRFDPQERVAISTDSEERISNSTGSGAGVTVASNLPEGDATQGEGSQSQNTETRERTNFEVSETSRELRRDPGGIRRLSVAVLVDGLRTPDGTYLSREQAELDDLQELVSSAVGFDSARGDIVTIKSMELMGGTTALGAEPGGVWSTLDPMTLIQLAVLSIVSLLLGLFVIRPIFLSSRPEFQPSPPALPLPDTPTAPTRGAVEALNGEIDDERFGAFSDTSARQLREMDSESADPMERLRKLISERQTESVEILRNWIEEREETQG